jgi:hypothetical protein
MFERVSYSPIVPESQGMTTPPRSPRDKASSQIADSERIVLRGSGSKFVQGDGNRPRSTGFKSGAPPLDWADLPPFQPCSSSPFAVWEVA